jgi:sulfur transfer complex TusBCD TusB component (DsrH family)
MADKTLSIVESAYRATLEEQDDTILWINHAMKGAGANLTVLLVGNAVNYAVCEQDASGLEIGAWRQSQPPRIAEDVKGLLAKGVEVLLIEEDARERGLEGSAWVEGVKPIPQSALPDLLARHQRIWHW